MAKSALLGVLERTIGKFVKDLDAEKLNLGIWSGQVELHDLELDVAACNAELDRQAAEAPNLAVPVKVVGGSFARLHLDIPWTALTSKSVVMKASGLHIQVAPHDRMQETDFMRLQMASEAKRAEHIRDARNQSLEVAELSRIQTNELMKYTQGDGGDGGGPHSDQAKAGFVAKLVKRIVENLQVDITDVQVSLEGPEGTAGMQLKNLSFVTTDMAGHRTFVDRTNPDAPNDLLNKFLYKKLKVEGFGFFVEETRQHKQAETVDDHTYVLHPLDLEFKFREADKTICHEYPKYLLKSTMPSVQLGLSHRQYQQAMALAAAIAPSPDAAAPLFPEYRPLRRVSKETAKDWWQYAYRCVGRMNGRRSWMEFMEAFKKRKKYIPLYKRHKHCKECTWMTPLSKEEEQQLKEMEQDRTISVDGIMAWRNIADARVEREKEKHDTREGGKQKKSIWSLFSSGGNKHNEDESPINLSTEELKELEDVGMEELTYGEELSNDSKLCSVEFVLNEFGIHMTNASDNPMLEFQMGRVSTKFDSDAGGSFEFGYQLQGLRILDKSLSEKSLFPSLLRSMQGPEDGAIQSNDKANSSQDVFQVHMSKSRDGDKKLTVKLIPLEAVVAPHLLTEIVEFTKMPPANQEKLQNYYYGLKDGDDEDGDTDGEKKDPYAEYSEYADSISNALVDAWREKTKKNTSLAIDLDLQAPVLVLPENCTDPSASVLVLDFGAFRFNYGTIEPSKKVTKWLQENPKEEPENQSTRSMDSQSGNIVVDHGRIEFEHLTFLVGKAETWNRISSLRDDHLHEPDAIIEPITIRFDFALESSTSSSIPRMCVFAEMPASNFKLSPRHVSKILGVYNIWMEAMNDISGGTASSSSNSEPSKAVSHGNEAGKALASSPRDSPEKRDSKKEVINVDCDEVNKAVETTLGKETTFFTKMHVDITTEKYSFVLYDSGEFQSYDEDNSSQLGKANIAEGLVLAGALNLTVDLATDATGGTTSMNAEVQARDFEAYSGFGRDLKRPLQIMEPFTASLIVGLMSQGIKTKKTEVKARMQDPIDIRFSMRNVALLNAIAAEITGSVAASKTSTKSDAAMSGKPIDQEEEKEIELIASSLENTNNTEAAIKQSAGDEVPSSSHSTLNAKTASSSIVLVDMKFSESKLTIINDLQGLDEALFRIDMQEFVTKSTIATMQDLDDGKLMETTYDLKVHTKFLADYFDTSVNLWKDLLQEPWEVSVKSERVPDKQAGSGRFSTKIGIHSMPLQLAFSEHFLISLASANHMFAMSSEVKAAENDPQNSIQGGAFAIESEKPAQTSRHLVSKLPYGVDNYSGFDLNFMVGESGSDQCPCPNGTKKYFRTLPPKGKGYGGKRAYGQDNLDDISIKLFIGDSTIDIDCIERELVRPKRAHVLADGTVLTTNVVKEGRSTMLRVASGVSIQNRTPVPMKISLSAESDNSAAKNCRPTSSLVEGSKPKLVPYDVKEGTLSKPSQRMGIPTDSLGALREQWSSNGKAKLSLTLTPLLDSVSSDSSEYTGSIDLEADIDALKKAEKNKIRSRRDIICTSSGSENEPFVLQASMKIELVGDNKLAVVASLEPRAQLVNTTPVALTVLTKKPHVFSPTSFSEMDRKETVHDLEPGRKMEVFSSGDALAVKVRCSEKPVKGVATGITEEWVSIPISLQRHLEKPTSFLLPFENGGASARVDGSELFIAEANNSLPDFFLERINEEKDSSKSKSAVDSKTGPKSYLFTVGSYGVDHTKRILFEQLAPKSKKSVKDTEPLPFSTYISKENRRRISLLPTAEVPIRIVHPTSGETKKSAYFSVGEVSMNEGGAQATPLLWDDGAPSGFYAYRSLVNSYQSELHIIPEFVVFNGSEKRSVVIKQAGCTDIKVDPGKTAPVFMASRKAGLPLSFHYSDVGGATRTLQLENLGLHVEMLRSQKDEPLGSLSIQTAIGSIDSRLVIRLGELGEIEREKPYNPIESIPGVHPDDVLRVRVQADKFSLTLNEAIPAEELKAEAASPEAASKSSDSKSKPRPSLSMVQKAGKSSMDSLFEPTERPVCTFLVDDFLFDVQRLFKKNEDLKSENDVAERCQVSLIVSKLQIKDETPGSPFPQVLDYTASSHFVDCCVRTKGPLFARNVKIDLLDMVLGNSSGNTSDKSDAKIVFQSSEDFVWKLIDTAAGIAHASEHGSDRDTENGLDHAMAAYVPDYNARRDIVQHMRPQIATIYDIATAKVSPFTVVVSFKRRPQAQRYESYINTKSAHLMRYFTQQLKFTVDNCKLKFSRYEADNLKGPIDRLIEILTAVYVGRVKLKMVAILSAVSFADWKNLAARDEGDDEFVDGDVLRVTGTLAGNSVGYVFNKVGRGVNKGVTAGFGVIGGGIENATALVGAREFGAGINTVVTGIGGGVGGTIQGVGEGASSVFKGAGKGVGQLFGGIGGGASQMVKGLGKGIAKGDGGAIASGFKDGARAMGSGVKGSATSVTSGVGSGVSSLARGTVSGVRESRKKKDEK